MKKAVLVMDMPKVCLDCPMCFKADEMSIGFLVYKHLYSCRFAPSDVEDFYIENIAKGKPDWCPLIEMTEEKAKEIKIVKVKEDERKRKEGL